jgi:hypothetical protein
MLGYLSTFKSIRYSVSKGPLGYIDNTIKFTLVIIGSWIVWNQELYLIKTPIHGNISILEMFVPKINESDIHTDYCFSNYSGKYMNFHKLAMFNCMDYKDGGVHLIKNPYVFEVSTSSIGMYDAFIYNVEDTEISLTSSVNHNYILNNIFVDYSDKNNKFQHHFVTLSKLLQMSNVSLYDLNNLNPYDLPYRITGITLRVKTHCTNSIFNEIVSCKMTSYVEPIIFTVIHYQDTKYNHYGLFYTIIEYGVRIYFDDFDGDYKQITVMSLVSGITSIFALTYVSSYIILYVIKYLVDFHIWQYTYRHNNNVYLGIWAGELTRIQYQLNWLYNTHNIDADIDRDNQYVELHDAN